MPTIPEFISDNGRPFVCWSHALGRCFYGNRCSFRAGHPTRAQIPDKFATDVCQFLAGGIEAMVKDRGGAPGKKDEGRKRRGGSMTAGELGSPTDDGNGGEVCGG